MRVRSISMPGTLRGAEPVARMISLRARSVCVSPSKTSMRAAARQPRGALDPVNLVLLEEKLDPLRHPADDAILSRVHLRHVEAERSRSRAGDTPLLRLLNDLEGVGVLEQRLRRDAAPQQARPAERLLFLDHRDGKAELRCADGGDITAGARADHDDVVFLHRDESQGSGVIVFELMRSKDPADRHSSLQRRKRHEGGRAGRARRSAHPVSGSAVVGSRRVTRARSCPYSYRSSQYDSVSRSSRLATRRARRNAPRAKRRAAPMSSH